MNSIAGLGAYASSILNSSAVSTVVRLIPGFDSLLNTMQKVAQGAVQLKNTLSQLKALSVENRTTIPRLLWNLIKEAGGLGNPASQTTTALGGGVKGGEVEPRKGGVL